MSTDMTGNPHYALNLPDKAGGLDGRVITEATLALAFEQRTTTLIAYWDAMTQEEFAHLSDEDQAKFRNLQEIIEKRLGLDDD